MFRSATSCTGSRSPGRRLLRALVAVPFVLPTVVVGVAFRTLLAESGPLGGLGLDGTATAIIAALVFFNVSVVVRTVGGMWEGLDRRRRGGRRRARRHAAPGASARSRCRRSRPAIRVRRERRVPLLRDAFGVVLTLGGLRYATVETEIYLLTTQFLDLQAAAALSVLQLRRRDRAPAGDVADHGARAAPAVRAAPTATPAAATCPGPA